MPALTSISANSFLAVSLAAGSSLSVFGSGTVQLAPPAPGGASNAQRTIQSGETRLGPYEIAATINNPANVPQQGTVVTVFMSQNGTGGSTVAWGANYIFPTAWSNTGNTANKSSSIAFVSDGSKLVAMGANAWY